MALYRYLGVNKEKTRCKGVVEAEDLSTAKQLLREQAVLLIQIAPYRGWRREAHLNKEKLVEFTFQLGQLLQAGLPLYESLLAIEEQAREQGQSYQRIAASLCDQVKGGKGLSNAMKRHASTFTPLYRSMIRAGEASGSLGDILQRLHGFLSKDAKLRAEITTALIYPGILALFACGVVVLLLGFVVPSLEDVFVGRSLNGFTSFVLATSALFRSWWWVLPILLLGGAALLYSLWGPHSKRLTESVLLRIPVVGTLMTYGSLARFCRTLSTLQAGGVPMIDAMQTATSVLNNIHFEELLNAVQEKVIAGSSLSIELKHYAIIPPLVTRMLAIGEETGNIVAMMENVATIYEGEVEKRVARFLAMMQPILLIAMGVVIGAILLAVLLPLTDISSMGL